MSKSRIGILSFFVIAFLCLGLFLPVSETYARTILDKKTKKTYQLVETRKDLIKEFKSHVFGLDKSFKIYVSNKVVKDFKKEFKGIWEELLKDPLFNEIWKHNTKYKSQFKDYTKSKAKCWEWNVTKMSYNITKTEADDLLMNLKNMIKTKDELVKVYTSKILDMKENFTLFIDKKAMKNFTSEYDSLVRTLNKNTNYKNLMEYASVVKSNPYESKDFWKWSVQVKYFISPESVADLKISSKPVIKSLKELEKELILRTKRLDKRIITKVDFKALDFSNEVHYNAFWRNLYKNPEFIDLFIYSKDYKHKLIYHKKFTEWIMNLDYQISKEDVASFDGFVDSSMKHILKGKKTPESKVKAICDFMTKNYKLYYGKKGKKWYYTDKNSVVATVGNYSVNTSFALYKEKKGTSDAFANLFYHFAKSAGLDVKVVVGKKGNNRFSWNMVNLSGKWYHIATIHDKDSKIDLQSTYLKSNKTMKKFFVWDEKDYPVAKKDY